MNGIEALRVTRLLESGHWPGKEPTGIWADGHLSCWVRVWNTTSGTYEWWLSAPAEAQCRQKDDRKDEVKHAGMADVYAARVSPVAGRPGEPG